MALRNENTTTTLRRSTTLEIRPSPSSLSSTYGPFTSPTSPNTIITQAPSPYSATNSPSFSSSSPPSSNEAQWSISASPYPPPSGYPSYPVEGKLLSIQTTGIRGRKSFGELAREIQKIVRPPRERARVRCGMEGRGAVKKKEGGNREFPCGSRKGASRGRIYARVIKKDAEKKGEKKVRKKEEKVVVDIEAGLKRTICSGQGGSMRGVACECDGWKLIPREGAGAGSAGLSGTKMVLCNRSVELLKQRYAEEDE
ncbi:hypothetical protein B9Z19DRAFT_1061025 [Tuber borchii]|uniref:Uncharacterized protein n=1 Tax=Tuber borchii TaxID=42251 RepID=A0A2T7A6U0_TUBBO|nr:hypothetical protein B9Z19DRAFT_1061025 [Tuber borchii]